MALIAMLAGLSASAFRVARRNYGLAASPGHIQGIIQAARNTSISTRTPSFVVFDPVRREVWAQCFETVGEWSFEDGVGGGVPGRVGKGASFRGEQFLDCGAEPRFDLRVGVAIEAWVRHSNEAAVKPPRSQRVRRRKRLGKKREVVDDEIAHTILAKQGSYSLSMTEHGALEGSVGRYRVTTEDEVVAPHRWVFVELIWDGLEVRLSADGVERDVVPLKSSRALTGKGRHDTGEVPREIPVSQAPLTISSPYAPFPGDIDEVRLRGRSEPLIYRFPDHEHIVGWKKILRFDRGGHLDRAHHEKGMRIVLVELTDDQFARRNPDAKNATVQVTDFSQTFAEWLGAWEGQPPELDQTEEEAKILARAYDKERRVVIEIDTLGVLR